MISFNTPVKKITALQKIIILFCCLSTSSSPVSAWPLKKETHWPTNWSEFENTFSEESKEKRTVYFTSSIKEACEKFAVAENLESYWFNKFLDAGKRYEEALDQSEKLKYKNQIERFGATSGTYRLLAHSAYVEVLRQGGYKDWKMYSRYSLNGVGDLNRNKYQKAKKEPHLFSEGEKQEIFLTHEKYVFSMIPHAEIICKSFIPEFQERLEIRGY